MKTKANCDFSQSNQLVPHIIRLGIQDEGICIKLSQLYDTMDVRFVPHSQHPRAPHRL